MKTILITGCSSGFGLETARYFLERDWNVVATMRTPEEHILPVSARLRVVALDITDPDSIRRAMDIAGPLDVLVNNAGIGVLNALEGTPMATIREVFETNTFGTMAMTQAILPQFREQRSGVVINVTSSVTLKPLTMLSVYTGSKAAVDAFTESLALELRPFNVRVHLVVPGLAPETNFGKNAGRRRLGPIPDAYAEIAQAMFEGLQRQDATTGARDVAEAVWHAVTDGACPLRVAAGADAIALAREARLFQS